MSVKPTAGRRRPGMVFLHGVWCEAALAAYVKAKGPKVASAWMRGALTLVMEAEIRKGLGQPVAPKAPDAAPNAPDATDPEAPDATR